MRGSGALRASRWCRCGGSGASSCAGCAGGWRNWDPGRRLRCRWSSNRWHGSAAAWRRAAATPRRLNRSKIPGRAAGSAFRREARKSPRRARRNRPWPHEARSPRRASPKVRNCPLRSNRSCRCCRRIVPLRDCSLTRSDQRSTSKSCDATASQREIVGWDETMAAAGSSGRNGEAPPVLVADALVKRFGGVAAVDGVSISVSAGEIVGLIGPNGAGKTTLFDLLAGEQRPSSGRVLLNGRAVESAAPNARLKDGLGRTFQTPRPFLGMTLIENVMVGAQGQSGERLWPNWLMPARVAREERAIFLRAMELLKFVTLDDLAKRPARVLSGGQRKLLEIARALMAQPKLLLLDEPAAGVNPLLLNVIVERMIEINRQGVAILVIEHNMDVIVRLCGRVFVMAAGKLLREGRPSEVIRDPAVVDAYLGGAV